MRCANCGTESNSDYCPRCGTVIHQSPPQIQQEQPRQPGAYVSPPQPTIPPQDFHVPYQPQPAPQQIFQAPMPHVSQGNEQLVKKPKGTAVIAAILGVLLVVSLLGNGIQFYSGSEKDVKYEKLSEEHEKMSEEHKASTSLAADQASEIDELIRDKSDLQALYDDEKNYSDYLFDELFFYEENIALVPEGDSVYHKAYCSKFQGNYYAYNVELAQSLGYWQCQECHK